MPSTQSFDRASLICTEVIERVMTRVVRYSSLQVRLFRKVTSTPSRGEKASLMLTVETLYIDEGMGLPVVTSLTNPSPFMYSMKVL